VVGALAKESEEVRPAATSSVVEVSTDIIVSEAPASIPASAALVVSPTLVQEESAYVPRPVIERGSGSISAGFFPDGEAMGELARQMVQQFFASMQSCIDFILRGSSSFEFARTFLGNLAENIELTGGPSLAKACLLLVEQLGNDLQELKSLEDDGSFHEAQVTLTRLLAAQERERQEVEAQIAEEISNLEHSQAECQKLADDSMESELVMQSTEHIIINARAAIAKAEAMLTINEKKLATIKKRLEEQQAAKARAEESQSLHSSRLESLRAQLAAINFLPEEELRVQAIMEAEKARQHEIYRLREQIRSLAKQDF